MVMTYRSGNADSGFEHNGVEAITFDGTGIKALAQPLPESAGGSGQATFLAASKSALNASGDAPIYACRAWVNFNGTGTVAIRASGNVSGITDNGVGDYTVNFITAMPDTNYCFTISAGRYDSVFPVPTGGRTTQPTTTSMRIYTTITNGNGGVDCEQVAFSIFR